MWYNIPCSSENPFICAVDPKTMKGPHTITLQGENISSVNIIWKHNTSGETVLSSGSLGILLLWRLQNSGEKLALERTPITDMSHFWNKSRTTLELVQRKIAWSEAEQVCVSKGGHLASITSEAEQKEVNDLLWNFKETHFWLGGYDKANDLMRGTGRGVMEQLGNSRIGDLENQKRMGK